MIYIVQKEHPSVYFPSQPTTEGKRKKSRIPRRWTMNCRGKREYRGESMARRRTSQTSQRSLSFTMRRGARRGLAFSEISTTTVLHWKIVAGFIRFRTARVEKRKLQPGRSSSSRDGSSSCGGSVKNNIRKRRRKKKKKCRTESSIYRHRPKVRIDSTVFVAN